MSDKLMTIIRLSLLGISALLGILFYLSAVSESLLITWCYILLFISAAAAIIFPVIIMAQNPKNAKTALLGVGVLVVVFGVSYAIAGSEVLPAYKDIVTESSSKMVGAGLIAFYQLRLGAIGVAVFSEISKMFK